VSRVIRPDSAARSRTRLMAAIAHALRQASGGPLPTSEQQDLLAFIELALQEISQSIDATVSAWERRGYWLKADRFRRDWSWVASAEKRIHDALLANDLAAAATAAAGILEAIRKTPSWKRWSFREVDETAAAEAFWRQ